MNPVDAAKTPVPGGNPAGSDIRLDPLFDQLQDELTITPSSDSQRTTNWNNVVELSTGILEAKSKDLLVAGYLAFGLLHKKGIPEGLLEGVTVISEIMDNFWGDLFPPLKRMRGRTQALAWWFNKTVEYLRTLEPEPMDPEIQTALADKVDRLYTMVSDKCPDAPSLRTLLEIVRSFPVIETAKPEPDAPAAVVDNPEPQPARPQPSVQPAASAAPAIIATTDDINRLLNDVNEKQYKMIDFMLAMAPLPTEDLSWYRLNLLLAWFDIRKLPPATDGKTLIPPPDPGIRTSLEAMKSVSNWAGTIKSACFSIRRYPFWLDMNRYAINALNGLGSQYSEAVKAIENDTAFFIQRIKGIESCTFSDGTPFANQDTLAWLGGLGGSVAAPSQPVVVSGDDIGSKVMEGYNRCRELFSSGKQGEGLTLMQQQLQESGSARERCLWRLALLRLLASAGMEKLAIPHLNELMKDFENYHLERWEPPLALDILRTAWSILSSQKDEESRKHADEILARISMISPSEALKLLK